MLKKKTVEDTVFCAWSLKQRISLAPKVKQGRNG